MPMILNIRAEELVKATGEDVLLTEYAENYVPTSDLDELDESERAEAEEVRPCEYANDEGEYPEIMQWFVIDSRGYRWLAAAGEVVAETPGGNYVWGRSCYGQAITMDYVIQCIALAIEHRLSSGEWHLSESQALAAVGYWSQD